ncbi:MAG: GlsB/YeaQ/YmgE family stress response membrane protein [Planctomycetota bacterium]|nr:GlsB/YeaQ/YmgE family stress response membrane protein [Planctomycetota bacterium]MDA0920996.1 GlsB/YeaQ/YmgE family stress response membrane protein [Planctomycetota bacterium]MDA1161370.1 GlsB/YeaQ/YmgE family stress response membrane protein [Planctomycetota bacterium]
MSLVDLLIYLFIAGICGGVAQSLVGFERGGCLGAIVTGLIGAMIGTWIAQKTGLGEMFALQIGTKQYPVVWSVIGASLFVGMLAMLTRGRRRRSLNDDF